jgi:hypothetical protein
MPLSRAMIYVLSVWAMLILASFVFGLAVRRWADHWTGVNEGPQEGGGD